MPQTFDNFRSTRQLEESSNEQLSKPQCVDNSKKVLTLSEASEQSKNEKQMYKMRINKKRMRGRR